MASPNKGRVEIPVFSREERRIREEVSRLASNMDFERETIIFRPIQTEVNTYHEI